MWSETTTKQPKIAIFVAQQRNENTKNKQNQEENTQESPNQV